jgi:hypothetical protein
VKLYEEVVERRLGKQALMGDIDASVHVIATATNMCDGVNHYFKSDKEDEKELPITEACCRSFAAPLYFGQLDDPAARAIWLDGGCGIENMPLWQAYVEAWRRGWFAPGHSAHILALGCGYAKYWIDYETGSRGGALRRTIRAVRYFNSITRGSLARNQSVAVQVRTMHALAQAQPNFTFDYAEWPGPMPRELDVMDNVKARRDYYRVGRQVGRQVDIARLRR